MLQIDKDICNNCGRCVTKCPFKAMPDGQYGYHVYIGGRWGKKVAQSDDILSRKDEIIGAKLHLVGGATC